jgi:HEAT repeat protein
MSNIKTVGKKPTLGEVIDYYANDNFLRFIIDVLRRRRIVMITPKEFHWEPDWNKGEIKAEDPGVLGKYIKNKILEAFPGIGLDERPDFYPSFHQSVGKWLKGEVDESGKSSKVWKKDCVFETDLPSWRDSFRDVYPIVERMDAYDIPCTYKFSGHRSLHISIPAEILPGRYQKRGSQNIIYNLNSWCGTQAHKLPEITRMPYSLNEDTGLVCLPIKRGAFSIFRPWQSNIYMVRIDNISEEEIDDDSKEAMLRFLGAFSETPPSRKFFGFDKEKIVSLYSERIKSFKGNNVTEKAWNFLINDNEVSENNLIKSLESSDVDIKWINTEAFFLKGKGISERLFLKLLEYLQKGDEYVRPAIVDILLRFEDNIYPYIVRVVKNSEDYSAIKTKSFYLLAQSDNLRERVLNKFMEYPDQAYGALIAGACLMGSIEGRWNDALNILEPIRKIEKLSKKNKKRLKALDIMNKMGGWDKKKEEASSEALALLGEDVIELLLIAAGSLNRIFRRGIVGSLGILADERAVDFLISALGDNYSQVRRRAVSGLIKIGEKAVAPLIKAAASDQAMVRRFAIRCLGYIEDVRARPAILQALDDGEEKVRCQALKSLKKLVSIDDIVRLKPFLRDDESFQNLSLVIEVVGALGDEGRHVMEEMALNEGNLAAAYFIARHGDARGREILAGRLEEGDKKRKIAAEFLLRLRDERCIKVFGDKLKNMLGWEGASIASGLGELQSREAIETLIESLSGDDKLVRRGALRALVKIKNPMAVDALITCLNDKDSKVRDLAANALSGIGKKAVKALKTALDKDSIQTKHGCHLAQGILRRFKT